MKDYMYLNNNYYMKIVEGNTEKQNITDVIDIKEISLRKVLKNKKFIVRIDFKEINKKRYKKILKRLLFIKSVANKEKIEIGTKLENEKIFLGYIINYDDRDKDHNDFITGIIAIFHNTKYERYNYIYDTVCNYLDSFFYGKNLCDYLEKKGVKFRIKDILLLNTFFNPLQKYFIKYMVYTPKEKILKRLMVL